MAAAAGLFVLAACGGSGVSNGLPSIAKPASVRAAATSSSITLLGTISAAGATQFTLDAGTGCGYVHVNTSASTSFSGPALAVGLYAQVTGTGSCASSLTATSVTTSATQIVAVTASPSPMPSSTNVTASGPITAVTSGGFTVDAGAGVGYMHVYTNASTAFAGGSPKVGEYAQSTGSGSLATSITAAFVALYASAPATVTVSGKVTSSTAYGFVENAGSTNAALPVPMNARTVVGGAPLAAGATVQVTGLGSTGEAVLATSIVVSTPTPPPGVSSTPTPGPIAQKHLLTADYLGAPYGTTTVSATSAAPYLTWAQTGTADANAISAAGIETQFYADPNRTSANVGDPLYTSDETTFAHDCSDNRVTDTYSGSVTQYVMNIGGSSMQTLFANYMAQTAAAAHFNAVYEDDAGPLSEYVYTPFSAMPCDYTDAAWLTEGIALDQASSIPIVFNGLEAFDGESPSLSIGLLASSNTIGGNFEDCYSDDAQPKMTGWQWVATENTELEVGAQNKLFECQLRDSSAASSSTDARIYALASFLLTYNPATSILWEEFATTSGLHVEPEEQLVVLDPVVSVPATISALTQTGGAFGRQYGKCYVAGNFVGPCAVVVNSSTSSSAAFPFPQYTHTLALTGGGVLDGGTLSTAGSAPPATLGAGEAAIVFP